MYQTADHIHTLFRRIAPAAADAVAPFVQRLFQAMENGHAFIRLSPADRALLAQAAPLVGTDGRAPLMLDGLRLFTARHWHTEHGLAAEIRRLSQAAVALPDPDAAASLLARWFDGAGSLDQQAAAALTLLRPFVLIAGGPGTGKTTTVAKLLALLCETVSGSLNIALAAPTGKAAARLGEALHRAAAQIDGLPETAAARLNALHGQTVHRLLKLAPPQMQPFYHADNRLPLDVLVADEASMLDSHLMRQLLAALPSGCRVIVLGDPAQLPAVEAGAVLHALHAADRPLSDEDRAALRRLLPENPCDALGTLCARLRVSHRFGGEGAIGALARAVTAGDGAAAWAQFARFPDCLQPCSGNAEQQAAAFFAAQAAYWQAVDAGDAAAAFRQQAARAVLAARKRDAFRFNQAYRQLLQQHGRLRGEQTWFAGQLLMVTRNDPDTALFNGDIGIVLPHGAGLRVWFDTGGGLRALPVSRLPECEDAFAMTVHKSQGSEYGEVWLLAPPDGAEFGRALLYTALTRAKARFVYWGGAAAFQAACGHNPVRRTALAEWLA